MLAAREREGEEVGDVYLEGSPEMGFDWRPPGGASGGGERSMPSWEESSSGRAQSAKAAAAQQCKMCARCVLSVRASVCHARGAQRALRRSAPLGLRTRTRKGQLAVH